MNLNPLAPAQRGLELIAAQSLFDLNVEIAKAAGDKTAAPAATQSAAVRNAWLSELKALPAETMKAVKAAGTDVVKLAAATPTAIMTGIKVAVSAMEILEDPFATSRHLQEALFKAFPQYVATK